MKLSLSLFRLTCSTKDTNLSHSFSLSPTIPYLKETFSGVELSTLATEAPFFLTILHRSGNFRISGYWSIHTSSETVVWQPLFTVALQLKDNIECIHLMCAPGIVAYISRQINRSIITEYIHNVITSRSSYINKRKGK
jgi:hypothetical protein